MLKGTEKKIIYLKSTKSKHFDEAYFVLKDDIINDRDGEILEEAERIIFKTDAFSKRKQRKKVSFKGCFLFSLGTLTGSLFACVLCLIAG